MSEPLKILMELRPCFEGFAGIPQDTRLTYAMLAAMEGVELHGHLLDPGLAGASLEREVNRADSDKRFHMSRFVARVSTGQVSHGALPLRFLRSFFLALATVRALAGLPLLSRPVRLSPFDATFFDDFIWRSLFAKTLDTSQFDTVLDTPFCYGAVSWAQMNAARVYLNRGLAIDSRDFPLYIAQTPFPGVLSDNTRLVVRYHDSMPIQLPHTVNNVLIHQSFFYRSLKANAEHAYFICNSQSTRQDLVNLFPQVANRSLVVPCALGEEFYPDQGPVAQIIGRRRRDPALKASGTSEQRSRRADMGSHGFFLAVGTAEPRKNYALLLDAWEQFLLESDHPMNLVIVGNIGWSSEQLDKRLARLARENFHPEAGFYLLSEVPTAELRRLYSEAAAVVIPSLAEGFSFSGVEGMLCGAQVLASDISTHREVYGDIPQFFNPYSSASLCACMLSFVTMPSHDKDVQREAGKRHAARFKTEHVSRQWRSALYDITDD